MTTDFDPYAILQVHPGAEPDVIRASYEALRARYEASGDGRLREVEAAYALLSDEEERRAYDARRAATFLGPPPALSAAEGAPPAVAARRVPWGLGDMAKAIGVVLLATVLASIPAALIAGGITERGQDIEDNANALALVFAASFGLEFALLYTAFRFGPWKYGLTAAALGFRRPERGGWLFPLGLWISALAIVYTYFGVLRLAGVEPEADLPEQAFKNALPFVVLFVLSVLCAPLMEEVFFRGFIFGGLQGRWGWVVAGVASGALFGVAHLGNPGAFYIVPPIAGVGFLFAWGYRYSGSLLAPIIAHFLFNLGSIMAGLATANV